jgi:hypothetical protein
VTAPHAGYAAVDRSPGADGEPALIDLLGAAPEPRDLLPRLRRSLANAPHETRDEAVRLVAHRLRKTWDPVLAPYGVRPAAIRTWVASSDHEIWLWIAGDRTWGQVIDALAGRVARRVTPPPGRT